MLDTDVDYYQEQLEAKEEMLAQTTRFLVNTQAQLEARNKELLSINRDIFDSIQFASVIQRALLPELGVLKVFFKDAAYRVVQQIGIGGDNVFVKNTGRGVLFGLMDSTGHGIPAALLSISGTVILRELVSAMEISDPKSLLQLLNQQLHTTFNTGATKIAHKEGVIFYFQASGKRLSYCSARGKALYRRLNGEVFSLESTKMPIGEDTSTVFELFDLEIAEGDKLLIYSDGLQDQFGGPENKKFGTQRLKKLLLEKGNTAASSFANSIEQEFQEWKGDNFQTDDVSFIVIDF